MSSQPLPVMLMVRSLAHGGTERQVAGIAMALDRTRFAAHVACFDQDGFRADELRRSGIPIFRMPMRSFLSGDTLRAVRSMRAYIRTHKIRLVHTFDHPMNVFGVPAATFLRVPVVLSSQRSHRSLIPSKYLTAIRFSDRLATGIVVNCKAVRDHLITDYRIAPAKIHVCYNAIDVAQFAGGVRERPPELAAVHLVIGVVCVLRAIKDITTLVAAFANVSRGRSDLRLAIVGSGPERDALIQQAQALGIFDLCVFHPSTSDVAAWLKAIDIFVLPSLSEALSNSLMEAMAAGCCALASRTGGNPELVQDGVTGLLFEPGNVESLTNALASVIADADLRRRLASAGADHIAHTFSTPQSIARFEELYDGYLAGK